MSDWPKHLRELEEAAIKQKYILEVCKKALKHFGESHQMRKAIEELNECATALAHYQDGKVDLFKLAEEIADVEIMMIQMKQVVGPNLVSQIKDEKLIRLISRMK